jgi:hypothetical protein
MKKKQPGSIHIYHVTNAPAVTAVTAFADAVVDGETFFGNELVEKETYFGIYTPRSFRVAYYGQKWGTPTIYTCQLRRCSLKCNPARAKLWDQENPPLEMKKAMRHFLGYMLVHDIQIWAAMKNLHKYQNAAWKTFRDFLGEWDGNEEFTPYWHTDSPVKISSSAPKRIIASLYRRGDKAVIVVMNDTAVKHDINIAVDGNKLFKHPCKIRVMDAGKKTLPFERDSWISQVPGEDFTIYLVKADR